MLDCSQPVRSFHPRIQRSRLYIGACPVLASVSLRWPNPHGLSNVWSLQDHTCRTDGGGSSLSFVAGGVSCFERGSGLLTTQFLLSFLCFACSPLGIVNRILRSLSSFASRVVASCNAAAKWVSDQASVTFPLVACFAALRFGSTAERIRGRGALFRLNWAFFGERRWGQTQNTQ